MKGEQKGLEIGIVKSLSVWPSGLPDFIRGALAVLIIGYDQSMQVRTAYPDIFCPLKLVKILTIPWFGMRHVLFYPHWRESG